MHRFRVAQSISKYDKYLLDIRREMTTLSTKIPGVRIDDAVDSVKDLPQLLLLNVKVLAVTLVVMQSNEDIFISPLLTEALTILFPRVIDDDEIKRKLKVEVYRYSRAILNEGE